MVYTMYDLISVVMPASSDISDDIWIPFSFFLIPLENVKSPRFFNNGDSIDRENVSSCAPLKKFSAYSYWLLESHLPALLFDSAS